ncbi:MAG: phosphate ABC transporter permease PstA [Hydrogenibacillus sp.]|nr:phosphate ABC transporter permease PstA [Hydrogenibacillus sp.]
MNAKIIDRVMTVVFYAIALLLIVILFGLIGYILARGVPKLSLTFLTGPPRSLEAGSGIGTPLFNSLYMLFLTMVFTVPIGVGGGIYLAEYARPGRLTDAIRAAIEVLSSLPSIVVGLFGFLVFVYYTGWGYTLMGGALALMLFNLPLMVRTSEEAIRAVPHEQKEASLALGISHWRTITDVLFPSALPGIVTGAILTAGRAFGEAAALIFTSGMSSPPLDFHDWNPLSSASPLNPFRPGETLAVNIWKVNSEGLIPDAKEVAAGASAVLVLSVLLFNVLARFASRYVYRKMTASKS